MEVHSYVEAATIFSKHISTHYDVYFTTVHNLIIALNRIGRFDQAKQLKLRMDSIRPSFHPSSSSSSSSSRNEQLSQSSQLLSPTFLFTFEQDNNKNTSISSNNNSTMSTTRNQEDEKHDGGVAVNDGQDSDEDLFSPEDAYIPTFQSIHPSSSSDDDDDNNNNNNDNDDGIGCSNPSDDEQDEQDKQREWMVVEEMELEQENASQGNLEQHVETALTDQEDYLKAKITAKSGNPLSEAKSRMHLGSFYQQAGRYTDATAEYRKVQNLIGLSPRHEELYHASSRSLGVSLRESGDLKGSVSVLNKDVDVIVVRRGRNAGHELHDYYDAELCRSCEELGNSWMV